MGEVVAVIKVLPSDVEVFDAMKEKILASFDNIKKNEVEPIAFGLKALNLTFVVGDGEGGTEPIENKLKEFSEVGEVEVVGLARL